MGTNPGLRKVVKGDRHTGRPDTHRRTVFNQFQVDEFLKCLLDCHHGMARPQVADGGTASNMEGGCEYIE